MPKKNRTHRLHHKPTKTLTNLANMDLDLVSTPIPNDDVQVQKNMKNISKKTLSIGIFGFGDFGQFLAKTFVKHHTVYAISKSDYTTVAKNMGCRYISLDDVSTIATLDLDVILFSVSIMSFHQVLVSLPKNLFHNKLIVDVLSVKEYPCKEMKEQLPKDCDILCTHPMFGPESGKFGWKDLTFVYDKIRITNETRCKQFLQIWKKEECNMIKMSCEQHDKYTAKSQFVTHFTSRIIEEQTLAPTPIDTKGFETLLNLSKSTCKDSFELFYGLYFYNKHAIKQLTVYKDALHTIEKRLSEYTNKSK